MENRKRLPKYLVLEKRRGQTPLELLQELRQKTRELENVPLSYAGRLDPMAEGKLLVLVGDECKKQEKYTKLDKEYEVTILLGAKTDTGDLLGLVEYSSSKHSKTNGFPQAIIKTGNTRVLKKRLKKAFARELGAHSRRYPAFSSKTVNGKPLFLYALEGKLGEITMPEHIEKMYRISLRMKDLQDGIEEIPSADLEKRIQEALSIVPRSDEPSKELGENFRQDAVRACWREFFQSLPSNSTFCLLSLLVTCASGAYMRTLAERIGASVDAPALAFSIKRTKIGTYQKMLGLWTKLY